MKPTFDVLVIGGGIVGQSAALAMTQRDYSVGLIDAGPLTANTRAIDSRVYAINSASQKLLCQLGVWDHIDSSRVSPYHHMHIWDAANGAHIDFDTRIIGTDRLGSIIEESIIKKALLTQVSLENITTFPNCRITKIETTDEGITVHDGSHTWQTKLLMVADGANSLTRSLLGISTHSWPYHQQALVTTIEVEKSHQATAYQVFNPDGPLAFLPLSDPHQCSIVWSTTPTKANHLMSLSNDEFAEQITQEFAAKLGDCKVIGQRHQFPLHMRHTKRYSGSHWLLMGDAAHTIHPLAGLGLNIGLADVSAWMAALPQHKHQAWSKKTLAAYQRQRNYHVWQMIALMEGLKALFANPLSPIIALRGLGLTACDRLTTLKRFMVKQAAGLL